MQSKLCFPRLLSARHAFVALESDRAEEIRIKTLPLPIGCLDGLENQMLNNASGRGSRLTPKDGAAGVPPASPRRALFLAPPVSRALPGSLHSARSETLSAAPPARVAPVDLGV